MPCLAFRSPPPGHCLVLTMPHFMFLDQLYQSLNNSEDFRTILQKISNDPHSLPDYSIHQGLILYKGKIWLNADNVLKSVLLDEFYKTSLGGHMSPTVSHVNKPNTRQKTRRVASVLTGSLCFMGGFISWFYHWPASVLRKLCDPRGSWHIFQRNSPRSFANSLHCLQSC